MDNGQQAFSSKDSFAASITVGEGDAQETVSTPDDLNMDNFDSSHNYSGIGNIAMNNQIELPMPSEKGEPVDLMMPPGGDGQILGEILDVPGASVNGDEKSVQVEESPELHREQAKNGIDSAIVKHFSDGEVNQDDVRYINEEVNKMSDNPAEIVDFAKEISKVLKEGLGGKQG